MFLRNEVFVFLKQLIVKSKDYALLEPPLISRSSYIEETLEQCENIEVPLGSVSKLFEKESNIAIFDQDFSSSMKLLILF